MRVEVGSLVAYRVAEESLFPSLPLGRTNSLLYPELSFLSFLLLLSSARKPKRLSSRSCWIFLSPFFFLKLTTHELASSRSLWRVEEREEGKKLESCSYISSYVFFAGSPPPSSGLLFHSPSHFSHSLFFSAAPAGFRVGRGTFF